MEMERMTPTISASSRSNELLPAALPLSVEAEKLALRIERAVRRGTNDKVRELKVVIHADGIRLTGRCGTYYCKQLAQTAAMAVVGKEQALLNRIEVW
jgi:hypothetical protein